MISTRAQTLLNKYSEAASIVYFLEDQGTNDAEVTKAKNDLRQAEQDLKKYIAILEAK
ncbi:hypothetical protein [Burkholderia phage vB_BpP_HN04]|nr:hypothetical protein [Burkholderia phage vB_BpP_HN01]